MAEDRRDPQAPTAGNDADAAKEARALDADALLGQLAQTTTESAGGNVSGTGAADTDFDIVFEPEEQEEDAT